MRSATMICWSSVASAPSGANCLASVGGPVGPGDAQTAAEREPSVDGPVATFLAHGHPLPRRPLGRGHRVDRPR